MNMKRIFQALVIAVFLGVFAVPSFASVQVAEINSIAAVDDEPTKKEGETETKSAESKKEESKDECTKSAEKKSSCEKEKSSCSKK